MYSSFPILFVGRADQPELRAAAAWLSTHGATLADDFPAALNLLSDGDCSPALIVLAEFFPPRLTNCQLHALRQSAPLAKIFRLLGPWFEGEVRTAHPLPATLRTYWHQWAPRLQRPLEQFCSNQISAHTPFESTWSLPITAGDDEQLLAALDDCGLPCAEVKRSDVLSDNFSAPLAQPANFCAPLIAVIAQHRETAQSLRDLCAQRGWKTVWLRTPPTETPLKVDVILFDSISGSPAELETVARLKAVSGGAPLVALQGFPRADDIRRWQTAGAAALVSKPFLAEDLFWQIEQFLPHSVAATV
ncbi:MAG TPA: response regulator [Pirellulales bacterium]|nr:response regulator [Pirellulales bacterium]